MIALLWHTERKQSRTFVRNMSRKNGCKSFLLYPGVCGKGGEVPNFGVFFRLYSENRAGEVHSPYRRKKKTHRANNGYSCFYPGLERKFSILHTWKNRISELPSPKHFGLGLLWNFCPLRKQMRSTLSPSLWMRKKSEQPSMPAWSWVSSSCWK